MTGPTKATASAVVPGMDVRWVDPAQGGRLAGYVGGLLELYG